MHRVENELPSAGYQQNSIAQAPVYAVPTHSGQYHFLRYDGSIFMTYENGIIVVARTRSVILKG
jgi:hypothetical protein